MAAPIATAAVPEMVLSNENVLARGALPLIVAVGSMPAVTAEAADPEAGAALAAQCAACHGADGVSTADDIPNLGV